MTALEFGIERAARRMNGGIAETRRMGGLGSNQRAELLERLG
ncbi:hypothetical protein [Prescottella equi]